MIGLFKKHMQLTPPHVKKRGSVFFLSFTFILLSIFVMKSIRTYRREQVLRHEIEAGPKVHFAVAKKSSGKREIETVAEAHPYASVTLYAKVSGYLKSVEVDKGDSVKKGQRIAVIESPETDRRYQAALSFAKNKENIARRMKVLLEKKLISQQEGEQAFTDSEIARAELASQAVEKSYEVLRAPFPGIVTARYADPGALIQNAMNAQTGALPVVTVSQVNQLRVYLYLDQRDASAVRLGDPVQMRLPEKPGLLLEGKITRISGELDRSTKMMLVEVDLDNPGQRIVPGSYVTARLQVHSTSDIEVPSESILLLKNKRFVALITKDQNIHIQEVATREGDGQTVSILSGLKDGDRVALNLGHQAKEGMKVRVIEGNK